MMRVNESTATRVILRGVRLAVVVLAAGSSVAAPGSGNAELSAIRSQETLEERSKTRLRVARLRIEPGFFTEPGECLDFGEEDLKVTLGGQSIAPDRFEFDRDRKATLHALLIDSSDSTSGGLDYIRRAASEYIERLDPEYERAMVASFDDDLHLYQRVTGDRERLLEAIEDIRPGVYTSVYDGLLYVMQEAAAYRERPVIVVLTDGVDTGSLHEKEDTLEWIDRRTDLSVFTIGFELPSFGMGPPRVGAAWQFLQRMADRTNGRFFVALTGGRLDKVYRRIREMLDNEGTLYVIEPDPEAEPRKLKVRSQKTGCRVRVFTEREGVEDAAQQPIRPPYPELPRSFPLPPDPRVLIEAVPSNNHPADPECARTPETPTGRVEMDLDELWWARMERDRLEGCALDVTMDRGVLYNPFSMTVPQTWWSLNSALRMKSRWFEMRVPPIEALPSVPQELMDELAEFALAVKDDAIERDPRQQPYDEHARPYHDWPSLVHGRTFFDIRSTLAGALFLREDYREWALERLRQEAQRDLDRLEARFGRLAPDSPEELVELAVLQSSEGKRILERAGAPTYRDLTRLLSAWLGDISAHDLFVRWETEVVQAYLRGDEQWRRHADFLERWRAVREIFVAPSYSRILTLLRPVHDAESDRIGFYRITLPRAAWYLERLRNYKTHPGWSNLPLDLVPDVPLAHWTLEQILVEHPEVATHLRDHGYRLESIDYELLSKPGKQVPEKAFRATRVTLKLRAAQASRAVLEAELELEVKGRKTRTQPTITSLSLKADGDPDLKTFSHAIER